MAADPSWSLPDTGSFVGVFIIVLWLVKVLVTRSHDTETTTAKALVAAEKRWKEEMDRMLAESEKKCHAEISARDRHIEIISNAVRMVAGQFPDHEGLKLIVATLPKEEK